MINESNPSYVEEDLAEQGDGSDGISQCYVSRSRDRIIAGIWRLFVFLRLPGNKTKDDCDAQRLAGHFYITAVVYPGYPLPVNTFSSLYRGCRSAPQQVKFS